MLSYAHKDLIEKRINISAKAATHHADLVKGQKNKIVSCARKAIFFKIKIACLNVQLVNSKTN